MTPRDLKRWRLSLDGGKGVTQAEAARRLNGVPRATYHGWESGYSSIPRHLPLACYAVEQGWRVPAIWRRDSGQN